MSTKNRNPLLLVVLVAPLVIAPLVLLGVYLGFYVGEVWGYSKSILAIVFSTIGFLVSMLIVSKLIVVIVGGSRTRSEAS